MTTEQTPQLQSLGQPGAVGCDDGFCAVPEPAKATDNGEETAE